VTIPASASRETPFPLGALFGREAVADLEIRLAAEPDTGIEGEIEQLGLRHRIATRRTSLIAVAEEASVDPLAPRRVEVLPVEVPQGLSAEGLGLRSGAFETFGGAEMMRIGSRMFTISPLDFLRQGGVTLTKAVREMEKKTLAR
jgi:Ca-activated chloride channel family protein